METKQKNKTNNKPNANDFLNSNETYWGMLNLVAMIEFYNMPEADLHISVAKLSEMLASIKTNPDISN